MKIRKTSSYLIVFFIGLLCVVCIRYFNSSSKKILIGYFTPNEKLTGHDDDNQIGNPEFQKKLDTLSIVIYAFLHVEKDGKILFSKDDLSATSKNLNFCKHYQVACQIEGKINNFPLFSKFQGTKAPLEKMFSIGGADDPKDFFNAINHIDHFVTSVSHVLNVFHLAGIDLDFEINQPYTPTEAKKYAELTVGLRKKIGTKKIISLTTVIDPIVINSLGADNWKIIAENIDYVFLMCYDIVSANASPAYTQFVSNLYPIPQAPQQLANAGLSCDQSTNLLTSLGVPESKIILGVPAYGHSFGGVDTINNGLYQPANPILTPVFDSLGKGLLRYTTVQKLKQNGFQEYEIVLKGQVIGVWSYSPLKHQFITYENPRSIQAKVEYVLKKDLAGMMIWRIGQDVPIDHPQSLLKTISSQLYL